MYTSGKQPTLYQVRSRYSCVVEINVSLLSWQRNKRNININSHIYPSKYILNQSCTLSKMADVQASEEDAKF
jgi:hypothetical protein